MINYIQNGWKNNCGFIITFKNGSFFETKKSKGYTHVAEHLMFSGTKNISKQNLDNLFVTVFNDLEAITSRENLSIFCYFDLSDFEVAVKTIKDFVYNWECSSEQFVFEKQQLLEEGQEYFSEFDYKKRSYVYLLLPIKQSEPLVSMKFLKELKYTDVKNVRKYWDSFLKESELDVLIISGGITDKHKRILNEQFSKNTKSIKRNKNFKIKHKDIINAKRAGGFYFTSDGYDSKSLLLNEMYKSRWYSNDSYDFDYDFIQVDGVTAFFAFHLEKNLDKNLLKEFFNTAFTKEEFETAKNIFIKNFNKQMDGVEIINSLRWFAGFQSRDYADIDNIKNKPNELLRFYKRLKLNEMIKFVDSISLSERF